MVQKRGPYLLAPLVVFGLASIGIIRSLGCYWGRIQPWALPLVFEQPSFGRCEYRYRLSCGNLGLAFTLWANHIF